MSLFVRTGHLYELCVRKRCFLQDFLRSSLFPAVQHCIQRLTLRWGIADMDPIIGEGLPQYLPLFPALRSLKLRGLLGKHIPAPLRQQPLTLDSLCIEGWVCHSRPHDPRVLCDLLRCFDSIGELQLEDICKWLPTDGDTLSHDVHSRVSALVLRDSTCQHPVCDMLLAASAVERPLRRLDMRALSAMDARGGTDLLESFSHTIEDFKCTIFAGVGGASPSAPPFDFSTLPRLRTLTLALEIPLSRARRARSFAGGEDLARASPWYRALTSLRTLRTRQPAASLKLLTVQLAPSRQLNDKLETGVAFVDALRRSDAGVRMLETALLDLVEARCVQLVQVGVYAAPPVSGLRDGCRHPCDGFVLEMFPGLRKAGVLRV